MSYEPYKSIDIEKQISQDLAKKVHFHSLAPQALLKVRVHKRALRLRPFFYVMGYEKLREFRSWSLRGEEAK